MGKAVDINHMPIHAAIALYKVREPQDCFEKVIMLARESLADAGEGGD